MAQEEGACPGPESRRPQCRTTDGPEAVLCQAWRPGSAEGTPGLGALSLALPVVAGPPAGSARGGPLGTVSLKLRGWPETGRMDPPGSLGGRCRGLWGEPQAARAAAGPAGPAASLCPGLTAPGGHRLLLAHRGLFPQGPGKAGAHGAVGAGGGSVADHQTLSSGAGSASRGHPRCERLSSAPQPLGVVVASGLGGCVQRPLALLPLSQHPLRRPCSGGPGDRPPATTSWVLCGPACVARVGGRAEALSWCRARQPRGSVWELALVPLVPALLGGEVDGRPCPTGGGPWGLCLCGVGFSFPQTSGLGPPVGVQASLDRAWAHTRGSDGT